MPSTDKINKIVWWIPIKSIRDRVREHLILKSTNRSIKRIVLITGQNCNLKCKNCANFSPYLSKKFPFYDAKDIINDLKILTKYLELQELQIQGGEFFIHPEQYDILNYIIKNKKIKKLIIATNGVLIPKDNVMKLISTSHKIIVRISNYGEINNEKALKLIEEIKKYNIKYYMHKFANGNSMWSYCGDINMKRLSDDEMLKYYSKCIFARDCLTIENGFISICSRATIAHVIQGFNITDKDGIFIRDKNTTANKIIDFANKKPPVEACYYCYGSSGKPIKPAEQMSKDEIIAAMNLK
ncbi:radical SAM protein [Brachyspira pulli]|uniref:radical SAM protein n=1 Tax=Brachyspira pulli TaxID=310721 RepID=UPI00300401F5